MTARRRPLLQLPFRVAREASHAANLGKTALQVVGMWGTFLALIPWLLVTAERAFGGPTFAFPGQLVTAIAGFALASALGLWSGATMAVLGRGTPWPLDTARALVVAGPYRWLRNPMACAGVAQGAFVGLGLGSPTVVVYALLGALAWNALARPAEEADLERRFGAAYVAYREAVRCWVPRHTPYDSGEGR